MLRHVCCIQEYSAENGVQPSHGKPLQKLCEPHSYYSAVLGAHLPRGEGPYSKRGEIQSLLESGDAQEIPHSCAISRGRVDDRRISCDVLGAQMELGNGFVAPERVLAALGLQKMTFILLLLKF